MLAGEPADAGLMAALDAVVGCVIILNDTIADGEAMIDRLAASTLKSRLRAYWDGVKAAPTPRRRGSA